MKAMKDCCRRYDCEIRETIGFEGSDDCTVRNLGASGIDNMEGKTCFCHLFVAR